MINRLSTYGTNGPSIARTVNVVGEGGCERCRILLAEASNAISAHAGALSLLAEAVAAGGSLEVAQLETAIHALSGGREIAIENYENHRSAHELKVMTAGSRNPA